MGSDTYHLVIIDLQEKLLEKIEGLQELKEKLLILLSAVKQLHLPVILTEQYPKGLGKTHSDFKDLLPSHTTYFEKTTFACSDDPSFDHFLESQSKNTHFVLVGIEAHICVLLTALQLKKRGFEVSVLEECVSSRSLQNKKLALLEMRQQGIWVTSLETLIFKILRDSKHPLFKTISALIK